MSLMSILLTIMGRSTVTLLPALQERLTLIGENIRLARLRRRLSAEQISERAGITRTTLRGVERGDPSVSFGAYANVFFCLGLENDLTLLGNDDELGRKLQDIQLITKKRAPRRAKNRSLRAARLRCAGATRSDAAAATPRPRRDTARDLSRTRARAW